MEVRLLSYTQPAPGVDLSPEQLIEYTARKSHASAMGDDAPAFLRARMKEGHDGIFEHISMSVEIDGLSRAAATQLTRYRLSSFVQESGRHVRPQAYVLPPSFDEAARKMAEDILLRIEVVTDALLALGVPLEDARYFFPLGSVTALVMTANLREWKHVVLQRLAEAAQWEIKDLARAVLPLLRQVAPTYFEDVTP